MIFNRGKFLSVVKSGQISGKRILVRVDFNIESFKQAKDILNHPRIAQIKPTIDFLLKFKARQIILVSHRGQPKGFDKSVSLRPIGQALKKIYKNLTFAEKFGDIKENKLVLFENIRFFEGETKDDFKFGKQLSNLADVYINDAFSMSHRANASVTQIPKFLPSFGGLLLEKEIKNLAVLFKPERPYCAILGGDKISTKLPLIKVLLKKADSMILGGGLANSALGYLGFNIGKSLAEKYTDDLMPVFRNKKLILPEDFYVLDGVHKEKRKINDVKSKDKIYDIGPGSLRKFTGILRSAKTVVWNGPLGLFEDRRFSDGTFLLADYLSGLKAFVVIGGGETLTVLQELGLMKAFDFVSTGGGAMLEFLAGEKMPGIDALGLIKKY